jgi:uncharacterized protein
MVGWRDNPNFLEQGLIDDFRPLPFLGNAHVQTLLGNLWTGAIGYLPCLERQVVLPDGDRLVIHESQPRKERRPSCTAVLIHGLGGSHESGPVQRLARVLVNSGLRVALLDLRGAGCGAAVARRGYHGGCSDDVRAALAEIQSWNPVSPLALIGFSLGGNIALKLAGEAAGRPVPGLERVAAVAPPIDLERSAALLALPRNRAYEQHFVRALIGQVKRQRRYFPDLPRVRFPPRTTLRLFDDLYTAPQGGFTDALDYYRRSSSRPLILRIQVRTLILTARDDPFIAAELFENLPRPAHIQVSILAQGGHLGFLGWDGAGGIRWAERRVADWVLRPC